MNLLPAYEQIIADKLEVIEIPDMADAIWSRIEAALDVEMPVNDSPAAPQDKTAVWMISAGILAIIIILFILSRNKRTAPPSQKDLPQQTVPTIKPDTILQQDFKPPAKPKPVPQKNTRPVKVVDTLSHSAFPQPVRDSLFQTPPVIIVPPPNMMKPPIDIKQRKKYGVEVSDSDYKFKVKPKE